MKKNCANCKHIDYIIPDYESNEAAGYFCNGREYKNEGAENKHLDQLNSRDNSYLLKSKSCHEPRGPDTDEDDENCISCEEYDEFDEDLIEPEEGWHHLPTDGKNAQELTRVLLKHGHSSMATPVANH